MKNKLYCFVDTNLFIQCKDLRELDWSLLGPYDAIDLMITRPVQKEIDRHKGKGNSRLASRSRGAATYFSQALDNNSNSVEIRPKAPRVTLHLRIDLKAAEDLSHDLDYEDNDDKLVGIAVQFQRTDLNCEVTIATSDTGVMATAKTHQIRYSKLPEQWLLPAESDDASKEISRLKQELKELKAPHPNFQVRWLQDISPINELSLTLDRYVPLEPTEIENLMHLLREAIPCERSVPSVKERDTLSSSVLSGVRGKQLTPFASGIAGGPPTSEEIEKYRLDYASWLIACEEYFRNLHIALNEETLLSRISVEIQNEGLASAADARITVSANGSFLITQDDDTEIDPVDQLAHTEGKLSTVALDRPPIDPRSALAEFQRINRLFEPSNKGTTRDYGLSYGLLALGNERAKRPRPDLEKKFAYKVKLLRHQSTPETVVVVLHPEIKWTPITGSLEVRVEATNLPTPHTSLLKVTLQLQPCSPLARAHALVPHANTRAA